MNKPPRLRSILLFILLVATLALIGKWFNVYRVEQQYQEYEVVSEVFHSITQLKVYLNDRHAFDRKWPNEIPEIYSKQYHNINISLATPMQMKISIKNSEQIPSRLANRNIIYRYNPATRYWQCENGEPGLPHDVLPANCISNDSERPLLDSRSVLIGSIVVFIALAFYYLLNNPRLKLIQNSPEQLKEIPLRNLHLIDRLLIFTGRKNATLAAAKIGKFNWQQALAFSTMTARRQISILSTKLNATAQPSSDWQVDGEVYLLHFSEKSDITAENCLVFLPDSNNSNLSSNSLLKTFSGEDIVVIIETDEIKNQQLSQLASEKSNRLVVPSSQDLTTWLLEFDATQLFLNLLKDQLFSSRISPYQTRGGIIKTSQFFGRDKELSTILNRKLGNYVLIGGRQLGKTSLLKRVESVFRETPNTHCIYLSLRDHRLSQRLAATCGFNPEQSISATIEQLTVLYPEQKLMILVDEADLFVRFEKVHHYPTLHEIRSLSDEGRCHFIFTGFWELYASLLLDYQSPLRNFGEVIKVGGLDHQACIDMAEKPMAKLGISYSDHSLPQKMAAILGHRANLMAIVCQFCLLALENHSNQVNEVLVKQALKSEEVADALAGWGKLTSSEAACRLDRIIVYLIALDGECSLEKLVSYLKTRQKNIDIEQVKQSVLRLKLAYVIKQKEARIRFAIPIFKHQFVTEEVQVYLDEALNALD